MTENSTPEAVETAETEAPAATDESPVSEYDAIREIRKARHETNGYLRRAARKLTGHAGLTQEEQTDKLQRALRHLDAARAVLLTAIEVSKDRDFAAHQAAKAEAKAKFEASFSEIVHGYNSDEDSNEELF